MSEPVSELVDVAVIGAGVTGLAAAAELCRSGLSVCVVERHPRAGMETSTHNSGVIHAGIYYPAGSLKAELCVEGARPSVRLLRGPRRAARSLRQVHRRVRREQEVGDLEALARRGTANGVRGLEMVDAAFVQQREPHVFARGALWSPATGRVEAEALVRALQRVADAHDGDRARAGRVSSRARPARTASIVRLEREDDRRARGRERRGAVCRRRVGRARRGSVHDLSRVAGEYAELRRRRAGLGERPRLSAAARLGHGLGVHLTKTTGGAVLLGPTVRYQEDKDDYERDRLPLEDFVEPARQLLPALTLEDITLRRQRDPCEAAPAGGVVRGFHDPRRQRISRR